MARTQTDLAEMSTAEKGRIINEGRARARAQREQWLGSFAKGEVDFVALVERSKSADYKAISRIKIKDAIATLNGWTEITARAALLSAGMESNDTIQSIRASGRKVRLIDAIIKLGPVRARPRPEPPTGWPFHGKMTWILDAIDEGLNIGTEIEPEESDPEESNQDADLADDSVSWFDDDSALEETGDSELLKALLEEDSDG